MHSVIMRHAQYNSMFVVQIAESFIFGLPLKAFIGSNCTAADWRDDTTITWAPYQLSAEIQNKLHHFFDLADTIASVDLIITRSDGYFLEVIRLRHGLIFLSPTHLS